MRYPALLAIAVVIVVLDQLTKWLVWTHMTLNQSIPLLGRALSLTYCHNSGGAFSLMPGATRFFLATGVVVSVALLFYLPRLSSKPSLEAIPYALILGGAVGNLIDRFLYGYVVDFLDLGWWPVFNIADSGITIGVSLLFLSLLVHRDQEAAADSGTEPA